MSRLTDAESRLQAAIARLEAALENAPNVAGDPEMAAALERTRQEYAALRKRADAAGGRLDQAIARLRVLIGDAAI